MNKVYLKVRLNYKCPQCGQYALEVVVQGRLNSRKKEQLDTESIIGHLCHNCNFKSKIKT